MEEQKDMGQSVILTKVLKSLESGGFSVKEIVRNSHKPLERMGLKMALLKKLLILVKRSALSTAMKILLMQAIYQENKRKPCVLSFKKALMKI